MSQPMAILLDNPLLVKHCRSRLRLSQFLPWAVVVVVLCLCVVYAGYATQSIGGGWPLGMVVAIQVVLLTFIGGAQLGGSVGGARETGLMDAHRVSPQPPLWTALGFLLGGPIREYVLCGLTVPFALGLSALSIVGLGGGLVLEMFVVLGSWVMHAFTLMTAMMSKKPKSGGRGAIGLMLLGIFFGPQFVFGLVGSNSLMSRLGVGIDVFGVTLPWAVFLLVYLTPLIVFLMIPAVRKIRSDRDHAFEKWQAILCMATAATLFVGLLWSFQGQGYLVVGLLYALTVLGVILVITIAPSRSEYLRGLRRARLLGRKRPSPWCNEGASWQATLVIAAIATVAATAVWNLVEGRNTSRVGYSQTIALAASVILYMGFGNQLAQLRFPRRAASLVGLLIFFVWFLPLILGSVAAGSGNEAAGYVITALSPIAGLTLTTGEITRDGLDAIRMAAVVPATILAGAFFVLLDLTQRQLDREVLPVVSTKPASPWTDEELAALSARRD